METKGPKDRRRAAARLVDFPADSFSKLPRITLYGDQELFVDGHQGIRVLAEEEVVLKCEGCLLRVSGDRLHLCELTDTTAGIAGRVRSLRYEPV